MNRGEPPYLNYQKDIASGRGIVGITKGDPLWEATSRSVDFNISCFDPNVSGFGPEPHMPADLWNTRMGLENLWWAHYALEIDDAIPRFLKTHGQNAFEKIAAFTSSKYKDAEEQNGEEKVTVGGFLDEANPERGLSTAATHEALQIFLTLEGSLGQKGTTAQFEQEHPEAFTRILKLIDIRWVEVKNYGGFKQIASQPVPDIWGTFASLETAKLVSATQFEKHPEEVADCIKKIQQRTPQILNLLKAYQDRSGGYGFAPDSHPNVFSTNQAVQIAKALFFFNHPLEYESAEAWKEFRRQNMEWEQLRMMSFLELLRVPGSAAYLGFRHKLGRNK